MALTFNATYYYTQRPDVLNAYLSAGAGISAAEFALNHYNTFGWKEGANPNEVFDTTEYLAENPDVRDAGVNPFTHYQQFGQAEGRAPNATFPSLAEFNAQAYLDANPDLGINGINTAEEAYDHYITFGYAENRPGAPDHADFQLVAALEGLEGSQQALADFLDGLEDDASTAYDETDPAVAVAGAEAALALDVTNNGSTRSLQESLAAQQAELAADVAAFNAVATPAERASLVRYLQLNVEIAAAVDATTAAQDAATDALDAFVAARAEAGVTVDVNGAGSIVNVGADGVVGGTDDIVLATLQPVDGNDPANGVRLVPTIAGNGVPGLADVVTAYNAAEVASEAQAELVDEQAGIATTLSGDVEVGTLFDNVAVEVSDVNAAQALVDARQELIEAVAETVAVYNQFVALEANIDAASAAVAALGFDNVDLNVGNAAALGVDLETDLFVYNENDSFDDVTITNFDAEDTLVFGSDYTFARVSATANLNGSDDFGSVTGLDIFYQQVGGNTVFYVENDTFDGQANGTWGGEIVTLVGVNADDISIDSNGIVRINDVA